MTKFFRKATKPFHKTPFGKAIREVARVADQVVTVKEKAVQLAQKMADLDNTEPENSEPDAPAAARKRTASPSP